MSRVCTCHPDDNPPKPCAQQYALSECRKHAAEREAATMEKVKHRKKPKTASNISAHRKRMKQAVDYLQNYMNTYDNQTGYLDYQVETLINDVVYGLGVAVGGDEYRYGEGFEKFKADLVKFLSGKEGRYWEPKG